MSAPARKNPGRFVVNIDEDCTQGLKDHGLVREKIDGRMNGISEAVNKSIRDYLRRI